MLAVVIPTWNADQTLVGTVESIRRECAQSGGQIVVSDGGSSDASRELANAAGADVVVGPRGRGVQLAAGARAARGDWLLFLHADTRMMPGWYSAAAAFMSRPENARRAGYFRLRFDSPSMSARRVEALAAWRCRALGLPYGDQGILIARAFYEELGGFRPLPLMEDVDLARRIGRRRLVALDAVAVTSARRYERDGWWARPARNLACLALWFGGVSPARIARLYR